MVRVNFQNGDGGGSWVGEERTVERALQNHFWRAKKSGLVWSVPLSLQGNDRESPKKGGAQVVPIIPS